MSVSISSRQVNLVIIKSSQESCYICTKNVALGFSHKEDRNNLTERAFHAACIGCLEKWFKRNPTCGICKKTFTNLADYFPELSNPASSILTQANQISHLTNRILTGGDPFGLLPTIERQIQSQLSGLSPTDPRRGGLQQRLFELQQNIQINEMNLAPSLTPVAMILLQQGLATESHYRAISSNFT
jgi:hypothetical protein